MIKTLKALYRSQLLTFSGIWHLLNSIRIDDMNLMTLLYVRQKLSPQQTAISEDYYNIDYRTLYTQSQHLADQLNTHCAIKPHQKIAVMATNQPILVHIIFALAALGADIYLLKTELSAKQLQNINDNLQLDWIIHDSEINTLPAVKTLPIHHYNQTSVQSLLNASIPSDSVKRKVTHCSKLTVLTSGTTGCFKMAGRSSKVQNFISPFYQLLVKLNLSHYQKYTLPHRSTMALV